MWKDTASGDEVLEVFRGADAYISPNWYLSTHEQHRQVPTAHGASPREGRRDCRSGVIDNGGQTLNSAA